MPTEYPVRVMRAEWTFDAAGYLRRMFDVRMRWDLRIWHGSEAEQRWVHTGYVPPPRPRDPEHVITYAIMLALCGFEVPRTDDYRARIGRPRWLV